MAASQNQQPARSSEIPTAPYVPFRSFINALDYLKQGHPNELDPSVWPTFSGGLQRQMLAAFRFLGLLDQANVVQPELVHLVEAEDRRLLIQACLHKSFPALFALDLAKATPNQFADSLRQLNVSGTTHRKAISFFLKAAKFADIQLSPGILHLSKPGTPAGRKRRVASGNAKMNDSVEVLLEDEEEAQNSPGHGSSKTIPLRGGGTATLTFDVDVWSMTIEDQQFVFEMIKRMKEYEDANAKE